MPDKSFWRDLAEGGRDSMTSGLGKLAVCSVCVVLGLGVVAGWLAAWWWR